MLQDERSVLPEGLDQGDDARVLGRDAVRDGRRDADDFLEHSDEGVVFVFARLDLAGVHAEGGFEVHSLLSVRLLAAFERGWGGRGILVWDGGDVLRESRHPFCCFDGGHCVVH